MHLVFREGDVVMTEWNDVVIVYAGSQMTTEALKKMREGYRRMIAAQPGFASITVLNVTSIPTVSDDDRRVVKEMTTETNGKTRASIQWVMGSGLIASSTRMVLTALNLFGSRAVKVVGDLDSTLDQTIASGARSWTRAELRTAIEETVALGNAG